MSAEAFLDTNVLVYAFDPRFPAKRQRARELLESGSFVVSWQVVQEFSNVALHRFSTPMKADDLDQFLRLVLWPRCHIFPSPALFESALGLHRQTQYRLYDCLIVASALAAGVSTLYSEDHQDGRAIGSLTVRDPFR
jgi:predicted nucleic acid-binding protein